MRPIVAVGALALAIATGSWLVARDAHATDVTVYTTPTCGCCTKWAEYLRSNGFSVETVFQDDLTPIKRRYSVPPSLETCHTAIIDGYVVEGHVPVDVIRKLLEERPDAKGIAVPGMPVGSPGMEQGTQRDRYDVMIFDAAGGMDVYAHR